MATRYTSKGIFQSFGSKLWRPLKNQRGGIAKQCRIFNKFFSFGAFCQRLMLRDCMCTNGAMPAAYLCTSSRLHLQDIRQEKE